MTDLIPAGRGSIRASVLFFICLFLFSTGCTSDSAFVIYNSSRDDIVLRVPVCEVEQIYYTYRQSYDRGILEEYFILRDGKLVPTEMTYDTDSYDYHGSRYKGAERTLINDRWHVTIADHSGYPEIAYRVGYTIEQRILVITRDGELGLSFSEIGDPGELIVVNERKR